MATLLFDIRFRGNKFWKDNFNKPTFKKAYFRNKKNGGDYKDCQDSEFGNHENKILFKRRKTHERGRCTR